MEKSYWCIVTSIRKDIVSIADPAKGGIKMTLQKFTQLYNGKVIVLSRGSDFEAGGKRESLFSLIRERLQYIRRPMIVLMILTLICVLLNIGILSSPVP